MRKILATFFLLISFALSVSAQNRDTDSLNRVLKQSKNDTDRVLVMAVLGRSYGNTLPDSAMYMEEQALHLSQRIHYPRGEVRALISLGNLVKIQGDFTKSLKLLLNGLQIAEASHFEFEMANAYNNLGSLYLVMNDLQQAKYYLQQVRKIMGRDPGNFRSQLLNADLNLEEIFDDAGQMDSAKYYLNQAASLLAKKTGVDDSAFYYQQSGSYLYDKGLRDSAMVNLKTAISISGRNNNHRRHAFAELTLTYCFRDLNLPDSVIFYGENGLAESLKYNEKYLTAMQSELLAWAWEKKDPRRSIYYWKLYDSTDKALNGSEQNIGLRKALQEEQERQRQTEINQVAYQNKVRVYGLSSLLAVFLLVAFLLYRNNRQKQKANLELQETLTELKATQTQLIHAEKMASLGELTAGIAHEIQNPLNFVNNFSEINTELIDELQVELKSDKTSEALAITESLRDNEKKINQHGKRADAIVKGMLQHSRTSTGIKELVDINAMADEYLRLSYHGIRAKQKTFNATLKTDYDQNVGKIAIVPQDIGRVLLNIYNNAFYAVAEKAKISPVGYEPSVIVSTRLFNNQVEIHVRDNGPGIPQQIKAKIFQPFFTTKPTGQGTGLGLSLSYDIIKAHGGEIKMETREGDYTEFSILLPIAG